MILQDGTLKTGFLIGSFTDQMVTRKAATVKSQRYYPSWIIQWGCHTTTVLHTHTHPPSETSGLENRTFTHRVSVLVPHTAAPYKLTGRGPDISASVNPGTVKLRADTWWEHTCALSLFDLGKRKFWGFITLKWVSESHSVVSNSLRPYRLYSPPGSSVHGILQARILEWVAISFSRGPSWHRDWTQVPSWHRDWTQVPYTAGRLFIFWASREVVFGFFYCS